MKENKTTTMLLLIAALTMWIALAITLFYGREYGFLFGFPTGFFAFYAVWVRRINDIKMENKWK